MQKFFISALVTAAALTSLSAQAVSVNYFYTNTNIQGGDKSGKTSPFLSAANVAIPGSLFVETFGARNGGGNSQGCGLDTPSTFVSVTGGTFDTRKGSLNNVAAAPAGDSGCYAYGPTAGGLLPDVVTVNYSGLLSTLGTDASLNYLGLYYGSIDTYNDLTFYNAKGDEITTITGASLISQFNGTSGNQSADSSNIYVNLFFSPAEQFTSFSFSTTKPAFEMDNLAVGFNLSSNVPEPGTLALLSLGLAGLAAARKRKRKQI